MEVERPDLDQLVNTLSDGQDLSSDTMRNVIGWFLSGEAASSEIKSFLESHANKGDSVAELIGAARAMRASMRSIATEHECIVDTCGTGGDGSQTFNISTAAAIVAASAGVAVAKHGNRKVTSNTGSADVLAELGVNLEADPEVVEHCLKQARICFCFAPHFHPAMRHVGPVRKEIPRPTIFNRLGPLSNPARVPYQVLGVGDAVLQDKLARALQALGTSRTLVVRGEDGVDELSISSATRVLDVQPESIVEHTWAPSDFGLESADRSALFADSPASSADCIREVLQGQRSPQRDVVVMNAAAALWVTGFSKDRKHCADACCHAIDSGKAQEKLTQLGQLTNPS